MSNRELNREMRRHARDEAGIVTRSERYVDLLFPEKSRDTSYNKGGKDRDYQRRLDSFPDNASIY